MESTVKVQTTFGDLTNLSVEKLQELETVLTSILALPVARDTFAQIIDGTRTCTPHSDGIKAHGSHPSETTIVSDNAKPSDQAMQQYEKVMTAFAPQHLRIDQKNARINSTQLARNYQNALPGSREHLFRLLEIAAASVNALAGSIYATFHPNTKLQPPEPPEGHFWQFFDTDRFYVDFYHTSYQLFENYPSGMLNVVGYWAEAELLGGVVLLERGELGSEIINAFLHPQKARYAFRLSEEQLNHFPDLGIAGDAARSAGADTILPFAEESDARREPTFATAGEAPLRIYKNEFDQPLMSYEADIPRCVIKEGEPEAAEMDEIMRIVKERGWNKTPPKD